MIPSNLLRSYHKVHHESETVKKLCVEVQNHYHTLTKDRVTDGLLPLDWNITSVETASPSIIIGSAKERDTYTLNYEWQVLYG